MKLILLGLLLLIPSAQRTSESSLLHIDTAVGLQCSGFNQQGVQRCIAGIDSSILNVVAKDRQKASQWCWAASIEAVLNYYGYNINQEDIVYQTWGDIYNMPGTAYDILGALNKTYTDRDGRTFTVRAETFSANPMTASNDLANDYPLIIGTQGHAMVLTALEYDRDQFGNGNVFNAIVRDPWPFSPGKRYLSAQEWYSTSLLVRIRVYN